jgi:iron complex outermembrane recepter protein
MLPFRSIAACSSVLIISMGATQTGAQVTPPLLPAETTGQAESGVASEASAEAGVPIDGEILVTARRRDETVQKVPIAIDVVTPAALANTGAASLLQIQAVAPGVNLARAPTGSEVGITIRGLGSSPGAPSFDSSVSLFVDGIYAARSREFASSMFDVQRIEVVKGTQAALLGKNTSLGAVNLITRQPGDELAADVRASYETEYGSTLLTGGIDLPLTDTLAVRVSGQRLDENGWVRNVISGRRNPGNRDDAGRVVIRWKPSTSVSVVAFAQHDVTRLTGNPSEFVTVTPAVLLLQALAGAPGTIEARLDRRNATSFGGLGNEQHERLRVDRYGLTGNIDLGPVTLTSITGYSDYVSDAASDTDVQAGDYGTRNLIERSKNFSQELRIVSNGSGRLDYVLGGLYLHNILKQSQTLSVNYPFGPAPGVNITGSLEAPFKQTTDTGSIFGQTTFRLTEALRLNAGARYTIEKKDVDFARTVLVPGFASLFLFPPFAPFSQSRKDKPFDYSGGVQYDVTQNIMVYASYGKGSKTGGFASTATDLSRAEYSRETARTIEAGFKAQDPGRRWLLNLAGFSTKVDDFQIVTFNGTSFDIFNTDLRSRGFELQAHWYPVREIRLFINNTFADAEDRVLKRRIPLAPKWSGAGGFNLRTPFVEGIDMMFDGSIEYRSSRSYQQNPAAATISPPFTTLNLSLAFGSSDDNWEARVIGRNLTDAIAPAFAFPTAIVGSQSAVAERGRTVALQLTGRF